MLIPRQGVADRTPHRPHLSRWFLPPPPPRALLCTRHPRKTERPAPCLPPQLPAPRTANTPFSCYFHLPESSSPPPTLEKSRQHRRAAQPPTSAPPCEVWCFSVHVWLKTRKKLAGAWGHGPRGSSVQLSREAAVTPLLRAAGAWGGSLCGRRRAGAVVPQRRRAPGGSHEP